MSDDILDDQEAEKEVGTISTWYGLLIGCYMTGITHDEMRRFICLDMATEVSPGKEAVKNAVEYERYLKGHSLKAVEDK
jgi:hypothetical protein